MFGQFAGVAVDAAEINSGAPPMEVTLGWRGIDRMLHDWAALTYGGMIDSVWFDVHAAH